MATNHKASTPEKTDVKWRREIAPVTKSADLPAELDTFFVSAGLKAGTPAYDKLMMALVSYITRRDATVFNHAFQLGVTETKGGKY